MTNETNNRWVDAFPWLPAAAQTTGDWWMLPANSGEGLGPEDRLDSLCELIVERRSDWTVAELFSALPLSTDLSRLPFSNRAANVFRNRGIQFIADLQDTTIADMLDWRSVGAGTIDAILKVLAVASMSADSLDAQLPANAGDSSAESPGSRVLSDAAVSLVDDAALIARWLVAKGHPTEVLLSKRLTPGTPVEVQRARARLGSLTALDLLSPRELELNAAQQLRQSLEQFTERDLFILSRRFFADSPETLDVLGSELALTRERVRQLEIKARSVLTEHIERGGRLAMVAAAARDTIGYVLPLRSLLDALPALEHQISSVDQPAWRILDRLDDAYEIEDGWCVAPTMTAAKSLWSTKLQELANAYGVVALEELGPLNENIPDGHNEEILREWLTYCGYAIEGGLILTRYRTIPDRVCSMLYVEGSPMTTQQIIEKFDGSRSPNSIRNSMTADGRIVRIDRDRWALNEWGVDAYEGIRLAIRRELKCGGGSLALDHLQQVITSKYTVAATSVATYASMPPFETIDGIVSVAQTFRQVRKTPAQTRRLYRGLKKWVLRVTVTKDHLRGSGYTAPTALASILDLHPGETMYLPSPIGDQTVYWTGPQPSVGSIRRFLLDDNIDAHDEVFLEFHDDQGFAITKIAPLTGDPIHDALALVGANPEGDEDPRATLATAIEQPPLISHSRLVEEYRSRGDGEIAELLVTGRQQLADSSPLIAPVPAPEISEILDLL
ncbi:DNA-directed RNA polymerase subunit alpha C-terminal domain-containing protein [Prescottella equi]|uniref:DNA-directed RNA polymerase subunit alpha C-terminal domain-containing protein n=1 Tax=Rhodococcus hoagii TaxID=43767 RepID=UPI001EEC555E|nr:sigma factor-like helix-turn-helix DNA-binding protein [Prescottella equi]